MRNKLISVLTDPEVGGTFLTWSIHYLSGDQTYYYAKTLKWLSVCDNPLTGYNAHNFKPNQPQNKNSFDITFNRLCSTDTLNFHTIYFHNFEFANLSHDNNLDHSINKLIDAKSKIVLVNTNKKHFLYKTKQHPRHIDHADSIDNHWENYINYFFKESKTEWKNLNLVEIWDLREFLALNYDPENIATIAPSINLKHPHFLIDSFELYNTFHQTLHHLFDFLEVKIDHNRKQLWQNIFNQWQKNHTQNMLFVWYFDEIIDSILNNHYLDLTRFNLDIVQESVIQRHLIYKHNLNLKTWQLDKFRNTQQLHSLLEPNVHKLQ